MSRIKIKNFGPIKDGYDANDGWMDIKKVTVFIGNQGSGKSTVAKVISTLSWMEKSFNRGDIHKSKLSLDNFFKFFEYQRIRSYFRDDTVIEYEGEVASISYNKKMKWPVVEYKPSHNFKVPKIMYVPAERNFLSVVKNAYGMKNLPDTLYTFAEEVRKGQLELKGNLLPLPISTLKYEYDNDNETSYIVGDGFKLDLLESSSGFQSFVPLYLVTKFLTDDLQKGENVLREQLSVKQSVRRNEEIAEVMFDNTLSSNEKNSKVKEIDSKYLNTCFINIVEEPEQNLFPLSQWQMLQSLLTFNELNVGNKLIMTTHSPYIINYLSLSIQGKYLENKIKKSTKGGVLLSKLYEIIPENALVSSSNVIIYQLDDQDGSIKKLDTIDGIPSDENYLNSRLAEGNHLFDSLLEIEQEL